MAIDWITVSAQIVNFLVLVWLLKRFLYQPVIRAMDRREQRIAERLDEAQRREQQAQEQKQEYQLKADELEQRREEIVNLAKEVAEREKLKLIDQARVEVREQQSQWRQQVNEEKDEFLKNLRIKSADAIQVISRKALADLANAELETHIIESFLFRIKSMDKKHRKALAEALDEMSEPLRIRTAYALDSTMRARITRAVHEHIAEGTEIQYGESEQLLCGIELSGGGQRVSWSLAEYLDELRRRVEEVFVATGSSE